MAQSRRNESGSSLAPSRRRKRVDALVLLKADHKEVRELFKRYEELMKSQAKPLERQIVAERVCGLVTVHATIEEELFYPEARALLDSVDTRLLDEAEVEHASARDLIRQIEDACAEDELFDAKVRVLGEYIDHHAREEEKELFPKVKKAGMDLHAIGEELATRKAELMSALDLAAEEGRRGRIPELALSAGRER